MQQMSFDESATKQRDSNGVYTVISEAANTIDDLMEKNCILKRHNQVLQNTTRKLVSENKDIKERCEQLQQTNQNIISQQNYDDERCEEILCKLGKGLDNERVKELWRYADEELIKELGIDQSYLVFDNNNFQ